MVDAYQPGSAPQADTRTLSAVPTTSQAFLPPLLQYLAGRVRREHLETWFRSLNVGRVGEQEVELTVTTQFVRDWLQRNFLSVLQDAVSHVSGSDGGQTGGQASGPASGPVRRVILSQRAEDNWDSLSILDPDAEAVSAERVGRLGDLDAVSNLMRTRSELAMPAARPAAQSNQPSFHRRAPNSLNPNNTFDKFVVGSCNQFAHASALATAENPGCAFNPLFVHGSVGLGKTHLLQAICHAVQKRDPNAKVLYLSCEDFTNAYIQAIQNRELDAFREYFRSADVLVIDDVQFLANKDKTQDEFFHTFNALYDAQKQIVLSSDRPAGEIPTIEDRLVSRFKWGMVAEVQAPALETRAAIVRRKANGRGIDLPNDVALFLAERVTSNIRELEGAVIKVVGVAAITNQPINLQLAENCMRGMVVRHAQVSVDDIMGLVTTEFAISSRELTGKGRTQTVSLPRQIAMFLLREHTDSSLDEVGRMFGNRDHTTVLYAVNKIRERTQKDRMFKELIDGLSSRLLTRSVRS